MADNFGTRQDRVLTVADRSLDNVVFQKATPPLSSEWNLINQISNQKVQDLSKVMLPSGWLNIGGIYQDKAESLFVTGDVNCSFDYSANSFKLCGIGNNIAVVNGWPLLIKGTSSVDENNIIYLLDPTGQMYDFVFLEVWRKLVAYNEQIYQYGNFLTTPISPNEIKWDAIGIETTKRVQIQYRIRSVSISSILTILNDVGHTGDVFTEMTVHPIGGSISGEISSYNYSAFGASDGGLYVAGAGDSTSQSLLNTVDGYVYAIPMFLVYRRTHTVSPFAPTTVNTTASTKATVGGGYTPDRPDSKVADVVYKEDIVDLRHKIVTSNADSDQILKESVYKLIAGDLATAVKYGFGEDGALTAFVSGGSELMKTEQLNAVGSVPSIGTGSSQSATAFKRRAFSNAQVLSDHNIVETPRPGGGWTNGYTFNAATVISYPVGSVYSIDGFYTSSLSNPVLTGIEQVGGSTSTIYRITSAGGNNLVVNSSARLLMEFTFLYDASSSGFKDIPKKFLEVRKGDYQQIATRDGGEDGIPVRLDGNNPHAPLHNNTDALRYRGGNYTEKSHFGHEMIVYADAPSTTFPVSLTGGKYNNHFLLGVKYVETQNTSTSPWVQVAFNQQRNITTGPYAITSYTISLTTSGPSTRRARATFYTGSGYTNDVGDAYSLSDSFKFFELSKQGRGAIDTYEMIDAIAVEGPSGTYTIDTAANNAGDKPIIAIASTFQSGVAVPFGFNFNTTGLSIVLTPLSEFPILDFSGYSANATPTMLKFTAVTGHVKIRVPILVHSSVISTESPYSFFYQMIPYQGLLSSTTNFFGKIEKEGPGMITTLGSGAIINVFYNGGRVNLTTGSKAVTGEVDANGDLPVWTQYVQPGDYFIGHLGTGIEEHIFNRYYRIETVTNDTNLYLSEDFEGTATYIENFLPAAVNTTNNTITLSQARVLNERIQFTNSGGALPSGLLASTNYYVVQAGTTIKVASSEGGAAISISTQGTGTHHMTAMTNDYEIIRLDIPADGIANVIDRLPSYKIIATSSKDVTDYRCASDQMEILNNGYTSPLLMTNPHMRSNDPLNAWVNDFNVGNASVSKRGKNDFYLSGNGATNPAFKLVMAGGYPRPYLVYQSIFTTNNRKIVQAYLFQKSAKDMISGESGLTGRLYLMIIASEVTDVPENRIKGRLVNDIVDVFELSGRPVIKI